MPEEQAGGDDLTDAGRTEGFGERLLGSLLDRAHTMPPQLIAPLIAQEIARIGGREVTILLQDYDQAAWDQDSLCPGPRPGPRAPPRSAEPGRGR